MTTNVAVLTLVAMLVPVVLGGAQGSTTALRSGAKVFVAGMSGGFDNHLKTALAKKDVPVLVVPTRAEAEFEINGTSESQKAGAAKKIFMGSWHSDEQASISVANIASGEVVFAYSANKKNSAHGKQTTAEACAKHLKRHIQGKK